MASKKENLKGLFSNTRTRVIIVFTLILLILAVVIGISKFRSSIPTDLGSAKVTNAPGAIQSIPGGLNPTAQYAQLQEAQNVNQAQSAIKSGSSAIPTIVRSQEIGAGVQPIMAQGATGVGFAALAREDEGGPQRSLWIQSLQDAHCSKTAMTTVVNQGATLTDLKAGCSCEQLKNNGYQLSDLKNICSCKELRAAQITTQQLKDAGFTASALHACGLNACELRHAGFTAQQMKDGGYGDGELKGAGFSESDIARASGLPPGVTAADVRRAGCSVDGLKNLRAKGVSAAAIRRISGCSAAQLSAAGYTPEDLRNAGFSAADLKRIGLTPSQLKQGGYSARDLLNAGFTPDDLKNAGYSPADIASAEAEPIPGISGDDIKNAGCGVDALRKERLAGISAKLIRQDAGCSAQALKAAGFTNDDLANAGFTPAQINGSGPVDDATIRAAGCDPTKLSVLLAKGVSAKQIKDLNGCSAAALRQAGYDPEALKDAGFSDADLAKAGFTPAQLRDAGFGKAAIIADGRSAPCSIGNLMAARARGVSATTIRQTLGCDATALKAAGYTAAELKAAGFTAAELKKAGFDAAALKAAGFSARELAAAGFDGNSLHAAGFTPDELKDAGLSASALKALGLTPDQLKGAGFNATELKNAGYAGQTLKSAGFSDGELQNAGFPNSSVAPLAAAPQAAMNPSSLPTAFQDAATQRANLAAHNAQQLQEILKKQNQQLADQRFQQKIQQRTNQMLSVANQSLQAWQKVSLQVYLQGEDQKKKTAVTTESSNGMVAGRSVEQENDSQTNNGGMANQRAIIKTGDILFAVVDTSVNSDEPGPILATIVSGKLKGTKLIGSFNLPSNADKMVITFNTMSVPGSAKTTSINAYAIDPNTARTALASHVDHHYFLRYGSLFASSFLEGFGNAFQSADTTVTIGGTGGGNNITVQNGISRSALENAVIGLATVGKSWGQIAQQQFNLPTTVELCSGTGVGILFTQDVTSI